jgi:hypothetical protein
VVGQAAAVLILVDLVEEILVGAVPAGIFKLSVYLSKMNIF